jgi:hypothetical protein
MQESCQVFAWWRLHWLYKIIPESDIFVGMEDFLNASVAIPCI